jgi:hypothetical protein
MKSSFDTGHLGLVPDECVSIELKVCPSTAALNSAQVMETEEEATRIVR